MNPASQRRHVCVITSNRADWSKLRPVALRLQKNPAIELSIIAVGSHLLQEFGQTVNGIKLDFPAVIEVPTILAGDARSTMVDSVGFGVIKLSNIIVQLKPDVCLIHGDRFDALSAAVAANLLNIVVAHIETPTSESELGAKGVGESGTGAAPGVVMCAVNDALRPFESVVTEQPMTPEVVLRALGKL